MIGDGEELIGGLNLAAGADTEEDDADLVNLSVYSDAGVRDAIAASRKLAQEQQARYDAQVEEIKARRAGPSFSERMFQLSAALATPTDQRGLGGILANVTPVLAAQAKAKRQGELSRREALEQLETDRLTQRMGLAKQDLATTMAMARLKNQGVGSSVTYAEGRKGYLPKPGVGGNAPMPQMNQYGYYVISDPRQLVYLPPNTPIVLPDGDQTKPRYTPAN
jgi:hypothetical protein